MKQYSKFYSIDILKIFLILLLFTANINSNPKKIAPTVIEIVTYNELPVSQIDLWLYIDKGMFNYWTQSAGEHKYASLLGWGSEAEFDFIKIESCSNGVSVPKVIDTTRPVITLNGNSTIDIKKGDTYIDEGATAFDNLDGNLTAKLHIENNVDTSALGIYTVEYSVSDASGNVAYTTIRTVTVTKRGICENLMVSENGHMLQYQDGSGFFWMGDTAWEIPYKLTKSEIVLYLDNRKDKNFSVIQTVAFKGTKYKVNGSKPFKNNNFSKPNDKYWDRIEYIVDTADSKGLYVGLLPATQEVLASNVIANQNDARKYGEFIGKKFKDYKNIIWIIGGDEGDDNDNIRDIWNALAIEINKYDTGSHLMTFHPTSNSSSDYWENYNGYPNGPNWLDFHMLQTGHSRTSTDYATDLIHEDYYNSNKPALDGESRYEDIIINWGQYYNSETNEFETTVDSPRISSYQAREIAYKQLFSGAFGHTFGNNFVWQKCNRVSDNNLSSDCINKYSVHKGNWIDAMDSNGSKSMMHLSRLMQSKPILGRVPDNTMIADNSNSVATKGQEFAFIYISKGEYSIRLNMGKIEGDNIKSSWYNPRNGSYDFDGEGTGIFANIGTQTFTLPDDTQDWVLILESIKME